MRILCGALGKSLYVNSSWRSGGRIACEYEALPLGDALRANSMRRVGEVTVREGLAFGGRTACECLTMRWRIHRTRIAVGAMGDALRANTRLSLLPW